jgi:hypothetical protein
MTTVAQYLQYAETALAAYASGLQSSAGASNTSRYKTAGMTTQEAERFDKAWTVLAHHSFNSHRLRQRQP